MQVALLGLGNLGVEIAGVLLRAGHELTVYNRTREKAHALAAQGARVASTPREAVSEAEIVLNVVFDDAAFEQVTFGPDGVLAGLSEGAVHAGLSTISLGLARRLEQAHAERNRSYIGAPVFGMPGLAREGRLLVLAAGVSTAIAKAQPIFDAIGRGTFPAGAEAWHANVFKLAGNFMFSSLIESFAEAQSTIGKAGLDGGEFTRVFDEVIPTLPGYMRLVPTNGVADLPAWASELILKDNGLMLDAGRELAQPMPVASFLREQRQAALAQETTPSAPAVDEQREYAGSAVSSR